jgi:hypothetical protein
MPNKDKTMHDMITQVIAMIDQAQALIDENRSIFKDDPDFQKVLDSQQMQLDQKREDVKLMKVIANGNL